MAKGRRNYTLEEQLEKITKEIANMEQSLAEMKIAKKELETQIKQNRLVELDELITAKGLSFEDVKVLLSQ